jgi:hypothetical protein
MPEYLAPGVFVEEVPSGNRPIEGVGTSTGAMIGRALKGPVNEPRLVTSFSQYLSMFGGFHMDYYLTYAVQQFFFQGGKRCYVVRAFKPSTDKAYADVASIELGTSAPAETESTTTTSSTTEDSTTTSSSRGRSRSRSTSTPASPTSVLLVRANSPGKWANNMRVKVVPPSFDPEDKTNEDKKFGLVVENFADGKWDRIAVFDQLSFREFDDELPNLNYVERKINGTNPYIEVEVKQKDDDNGLPEDWWKKEEGSDWFQLSGGEAGKTLKPTEYKGTPATKTTPATGLHAFDSVDDINIVALPALNEPKTRALGGTRDATGLGVAYCTLRADCVFLIDPLPDLSPQQVRDYKQGVGDYSGNAFSSSYAAMYYPWIWINDPLTNKRMKFPPSGAAMGTYANTDVNRGVHKAPAGTEDGKVRVAADVVREISKGE